MWKDANDISAQLMFPYYDPININKISYTCLSLKKISQFDLEKVHQKILRSCTILFLSAMLMEHC